MNQFRKLRSLKKGAPNADSTPLTNTFRPVQPIAGRVVYATHARKLTERERQELKEVDEEQLGSREEKGPTRHRSGARETNTRNVVLVVALMMCHIFA